MGRQMKKLSKGRPHKKRLRNKRVLIACNAEITEPHYFSMLSESPEFSHCSMTIDTKQKRRDPLTLVRAVKTYLDIDAKDAKKEGFEPYYRVWAVADTDDHTVKLDEAQREIKASKATLILSNPCFEVWLLDHVCVCPSSCAETKACERLACQKGLVIPTGSNRKASRSRQKEISLTMIEGKLHTALKNAEFHNTEEKGLIRKSNPGNTGGYAVWTDIPKLVKELLLINGDSGIG
ncbi:RloB family protein [[Collinsella] massiliensis]|nr:RloB family protein [[Collinsella] massiliensis]